MHKYKRIIEIRPLQREALFMEKKSYIKIREARTGGANEYVIETTVDKVSVRKEIDSIVDRFDIG